MTPLYIGLLALILYVLGSWFSVRTIVRRETIPQSATLYVALPPAIVHTVFIAWTYHIHGFDVSFLSIASLVSLSVTFAVVLVSIRLPVQSLLVFALPLSAIVLTAVVLAPVETTATTIVYAELITHVVTSIVAYSILTLAAFQALLVLSLARRIRDHETIGLIRTLPPLETVESMMIQLLLTGVGLLTLAIATGLVFLYDRILQDATSLFHISFTAIAWLTYASVMTCHLVGVWRARTTTQWSLVAWVVLFVGYFGTKFVFEFYT